MMSNEETTAGHPYKHKYRELKRKLKYLVYENECFESDIREAHAKLLQISREKSFILDQLMSHETVVISEESDIESTDYSSDDSRSNYYPSTTGTLSTKTLQRSSVVDSNGPVQKLAVTKVRGTARKGTQRGINRTSAAATRNSKTSKTTFKPAIPANNTTKPIPPLSLVVSLPRHNPPTVVQKKFTHIPPAAGRKKMKVMSPSSSSSSSSSDSDSGSSDTSGSVSMETKPSLPPPPPLQLVDPVTSHLLTTKHIQSSPVQVMTPNALTSLALVPSSNLSLLSPSTSSVPTSSSSNTALLSLSSTAPKVFVSVGDKGGGEGQIVKTIMGGALQNR